MAPDEVESPAEPLKEGENPRHPGDEGPEEGLGIEKDPGAAEHARADGLAEQLAAKEAEVQRLTETLKRLNADFDNYRKRVDRERETLRLAATEGLIQHLLDVLANFDRAIDAAGGDEAAHEGITLIYKQFRDVLRKEGVERIDTTGHPFDPHLHEAVMREETKAYAEGTILQEFEPGWTLNARVIRPAKVKVSARPPAEDAGTTTPDEGGGGDADDA